MTEHTTSYYAASANKYEPFPTLEGSINCDVCVVGGGYRPLVCPASGRNGLRRGGAEGAHRLRAAATAVSWSTPIAAISTSLKELRPGCGKMLGSMMFEGGDIIRERIQRYQIQCDYRPGGLFVAMNHKQLETPGKSRKPTGRYGNTQLELLTRGHSSRSGQRPLRRRPARPQRRPYSPAEPCHRRSGCHSPERRPGV